MHSRTPYDPDPADVSGCAVVSAVVSARRWRHGPPVPKGIPVTDSDRGPATRPGGRTELPLWFRLSCALILIAVAIVSAPGLVDARGPAVTAVAVVLFGLLAASQLVKPHRLAAWTTRHP